jgi:DNA-binding LacI/PurR family transcriptional regulator
MSLSAVSKVAGVSIATVSRVVNNNGQVSRALVDAVQAAILEVGYVPEERRVGRPRRLPGVARTGSLAVLFPDTDFSVIRTALSSRLLSGVEQLTRQHGLTMIVTGLPAAHRAPPCIENRQVDGVIVRSPNPFHHLQSVQISCPAVFVFEVPPFAVGSSDIVVEDNELIGTMAARWLLDRGHHRLAFVSTMPKHAAFVTRRLFFRETAEQAGASVVVANAELPGAELVEQLFGDRGGGGGGAYPTGIFVPEPEEKITDVYRALSARGVRVGKDVDVIGCANDVTSLSILDPNLANIDINPEQIGQTAVELLLWRLRHPKMPARKIVVPPRLRKPGGVTEVTLGGVHSGAVEERS